MKEILEKYYVELDSTLINHRIGTNGVDCWFTNQIVRCHRCLSFDDFNVLLNESNFQEQEVPEPCYE